MYGIYGNIGGILRVNVTIYGLHGSYGVCLSWIDTAIPGNIRKPCFSVGSIKLFEFTFSGEVSGYVHFGWNHMPQTGSSTGQKLNMMCMYIHTLSLITWYCPVIQYKEKHKQNYSFFFRKPESSESHAPKKTVFFWLVVKKNILKNISQWEGLSHIYIYIYVFFYQNLLKPPTSFFYISIS